LETLARRFAQLGTPSDIAFAFDKGSAPLACETINSFVKIEAYIFAFRINRNRNFLS
jgi:hypothetical protein